MDPTALWGMATGVGTWVGATVAVAWWTRSSFKAKLAASIQAAQEAIEQSNKQLMEAYRVQLEEFRREVEDLRRKLNDATSQLSAAVTLNQRFGSALAEKDLSITELQRDIRIRDARIMELESHARRHAS